MLTENDIAPLLEQGLKNCEIQRLLGVSSYVVSYWKKKLGYKLERATQEINWVEIQKDHTAGMTEQGIMHKYGISSRSIWLAKQNGKLIRRKYIKKWRTYKQIRATVNEANARYRAKLKSQVVQGEDLTPIKEFYKNCPKGYEVDHIIPLSKGGLHSLNNLQYLTMSENRRKSNKII